MRSSGEAVPVMAWRQGGAVVQGRGGAASRKSGGGGSGMRRSSRSRRRQGAWTGAVVAGAASTGAAAAAMGDCGREARRRWIQPPLYATAGWIRRDCGCSGDGRLRGGRRGGAAATSGR
ncbi:hypothetical protein DAI22_12g089401 [Oryza sativa Japonica Group]|nr:hypothetical protein DAI22_12g089401 [Oryza sativa Japonica Group]